MATSESAEILACALEADAALQESGQLENLGMRWDDVYGEILPINEIDSELFGLAMRFWDDWGDASRHEWQYHQPFVETDWPKLAREIAISIRENKLPRNPVIIQHFLPKPKISLFKRVRKLLTGGNSATPNE